jgi:hypothetical protein
MFLAWLSFVWGDSVRGPFAKLMHPKSQDTFTLHAGGAKRYPIRHLKDGIDFTGMISLPGNPIELRIQRTWWSGWSYKVAIKSERGDEAIKFNNNSIERNIPGWDINADD